MSVWLTIPSARPPAESNPVLQKWREQGYKIALWRDNDDDLLAWADFGTNGSNSVCGVYPGYARAVNHLVNGVRIIDPTAEWFVAGGDDTLPDLNHTAEEIAAQCSKYFAELHAGPEAAAGVALSVKSIGAAINGLANHTFGVMQPTGDRFAGGQIDRICGSPWMGREWCKRINQGRGPLWSGDPSSNRLIVKEGYRHMFVDEECQNVALKYGVLWQRRDLIHLHKHFMRESEAVDSRAVGGKQRPAFLDEANSREHWMKYEKLFKDRRAAGFPGSEPL